MGELKLVVESPEIIQEIKSLRGEVTAMLEQVKASLEDLKAIVAAEAEQLKIKLEEIKAKTDADISAEANSLVQSIENIKNAVSGIVPDDVVEPAPTPEVPAPSPETPVETPVVPAPEVDVATDENGNPIE